MFILYFFPWKYFYLQTINDFFIFLAAHKFLSYSFFFFSLADFLAGRKKIERKIVQSSRKIISFTNLFSQCLFFGVENVNFLKWFFTRSLFRRRSRGIQTAAWESLCFSAGREWTSLVIIGLYRILFFWNIHQRHL